MLIKLRAGVRPVWAGYQSSCKWAAGNRGLTRAVWLPSGESCGVPLLPIFSQTRCARERATGTSKVAGAGKVAASKGSWPGRSVPTQATETGIQGGRASLRSRSKDVLAEGPTVEVLIQTLAGYAGESAPEGELGR